MSLLLLAWKEGLVSFSSKSGAPLRVPKEGSLLESLQKGLMGVVSKLVNEGGKASCCLPGFFPLCCQSQQILGGVGSLRETPGLQHSARVLLLGVM